MVGGVEVDHCREQVESKSRSSGLVKEEGEEDSRCSSSPASLRL